MLNKKLFKKILFIFCVTSSLTVNAQVEIVSTGVGSAYVLNVPAVFPLRNGVQVTFKANVVCAPAPTINVSGTGAINIKKEGGTVDLAAGDIKAGQIVTLAYDGTYWQMLSGLGNSASSGSVTGTGTQNFVTKWNNPAGTTIGNSLIFDNGTNVGIGTTTPSSQLHVFGTMDPFQITVENGGNNFKTGYRIKTAFNEWFLGQETNSTSGFRITDIDASEVRFQIDQNGNVGIGTSFPGDKLHVAGNNPTSIINQVAENATSNIQSGIIFARSRGTVTTPAAVLSGDALGGFFMMGHDGVAFGPNGPNAGIFAVAAENFTTTANGTDLQLLTTPIGSNSSLARIIIKENGDVGIGTNSPTQKLEIQDGHILLSNTGTQSELRFKEASANGGNIISFKAPAALALNVNYTLPVNVGTAGNVLSTDGTGILSWQSVASLSNAWVLGGNAVAAIQTLGTTTAFDLPFITNGIERMRLNSGGTEFYPFSDNSLNLGSVANSWKDVYSDGYLYINGERWTSLSTNNTLIGTRGNQSYTSGLYNVGVGYGSGNAITTGFRNTFVGHRAGELLTTSSDNTLIGNLTGGLTGTLGDNNTLIGSYAGYGVSNSGVSNTYVGAYSGGNNTTGNSNAFLGHNSGANNTTGYFNTFVGAGSGQVNTVGNLNTFTGYLSGNNNAADNNSFYGYGSGRGNTSGSYNVFSGTASGFQNTTGGSNSYYGGTAGYNNNGSFNTFMGYSSGYTATSGDYNTILGANAGASIAILGTYNTYIGYGANGTAGLTNATAIGKNAAATTSNTMVLGGTGPDAILIGAGTSTPAGELHLFKNNGPRLVLDADGTNVNGASNLDFTTSGNGSGTSSVGTVSGWQFRSFTNSFSTAGRQNDFQLRYYDGAAFNNVMYFDNSGFVGIGNLAPSTNLHVTGGARITNLVGPGTVIADINGNLSVAAGGAITGTGTTNYLARWTPTGTELGIGVVQDDGTNVGINSAPSVADKLFIIASSNNGLGISNSVNLAGQVKVGTDINVTGSGSINIGSRGNTSGANTNYSFFGNASGASQINYGGYFMASGATATNHGIYATASGGTTNYAGIFDQGNVGVGTITPTQPLTVIRNAQADKYVVHATAQQVAGTSDFQNVAIAGYGQAGPSYGYGIGVMGIGNPDWGGTGVYAGLGTSFPLHQISGNHFALFADAGTPAGNKFAAVFMNGNVGIGTTTPSALFSVGATSQFQINSSGNIIRLNNISTSFPAVQGAANTVLSNDGSGTLSWNSISSLGGVTSVSASAPLSSSGGSSPSISLSGIVPIANGGTNNSVAYTAGSVIFSNGTSLTQNNANFFWDNTNLQLGIGTTVFTPQMGNILELRKDAAGSIGPLFRMTNRALGTSGSKVGMQFGFENSGSYSVSAGIEATHDGGTSAALGFYTVNPGGNIRNERLTIVAGGNVGMGTTTPVNKLDVEGSAVIGSSYSGTNTAPGNGLLVEGQTGIGLTSGYQGKLHVFANAINSLGIYTNGVYGDVSGTASSSRGTVGVSNATGNYGIGIYGYSQGAATNNYGVYGYATGGTSTNYAGYFDAGNVFVTNNLGVGVAPAYKLHVQLASSGTLAYFDNNSTVGGTALNANLNATATGAGTRYGLYSTAWYGTSANYGVYAYGYGSGGASSTDYGIYATAGGTAGSTNWAVYSAGNQFSSSGTAWSVSDQKFKNNIQPVKNALDIISKLEAKTYEYNKENVGKGLMLPEGKQYGFLAQDVERIIPEAVMDTKLPLTPSPEEMKENKGEPPAEKYVDAKIYNPGPILPIAVEAIKELNIKFENELKKKDQEIKDLNDKYNELLRRLSELEKK